MKKIFLTYGDKKFNTAKKHLCLLANESGFFNNILSMGPKDLDYDFKKKCKLFLNINVTYLLLTIHRRAAGELGLQKLIFVLR